MLTELEDPYIPLHETKLSNREPMRGCEDPGINRARWGRADGQGWVGCTSASFKISVNSARSASRHSSMGRMASVSPVSSSQPYSRQSSIIEAAVAVLADHGRPSSKRFCRPARSGWSASAPTPTWRSSNPTSTVTTSMTFAPGSPRSRPRSPRSGPPRRRRRASATAADVHRNGMLEWSSLSLVTV